MKKWCYAHILLCFMAIVVAMVLNGCASSSEALEKEFEAAKSIGMAGFDLTYSDHGILYSDRGIACYFDPETGLNTPLCTKINCKHQGRTSSNLNPTCDAYISEICNCMAIIQDKLYYVSSPDDEGWFVKEFYRADVNCNNRELLYRLENAEVQCCAVYENGYLAYSYFNQDDENGNPLEQNQIGIILINIDDGTVTKVAIEDKYNGSAPEVMIRDNMVYYLLSYYTEDISKFGYDYLMDPSNSDFLTSIQRMEVWRYNILTGENELYYAYNPEDFLLYMEGGNILIGRNSEKRKKFILSPIEEMNKQYVLDEDCSGYNVALTDSGVIISGEGKVRLWRNETEHADVIAEYDNNFFVGITCVTERWVYGTVTENGKTRKYFCPRKNFMNGDLDFGQVIITDDSGQATDDVDNYPDYTDPEPEAEHRVRPEDYYIKWAVPYTTDFEEDWAEVNLDALNNRLEDEGYGFGIKLVGVKDDFTSEGYQKGLDSIEWDIAYTGPEYGDINIAENAMNNGKYADLTEYIEKGALKDLYPDLLIDTIRHNGRIYVLPSEILQNGQCTALLCRKEKLSSEDVLKRINGSHINFEDFISTDDKLLYSLSGFNFVFGLGFDYDSARGVVVDPNGNFINPLMDEKCLSFMKMIRDGYVQGTVINANDERRSMQKVKEECSFVLTQAYNSKDDGFTPIAMWNSKTYKRFKSSTAINANSLKIDKAFSFLELIRTNHEYGNLLLYGTSDVKNKENITITLYLSNTMGIDDGLPHRDDGLVHFSTSEERKEYFERNVVASPLLYMDLPEETIELYNIVKKYLGYDSILFHENYDEELEQFRVEYTEAFDKILNTRRERER